MSGLDVLGVAQTGSGKTLSFLLPVIRHVAINKRVYPKRRNGPLAIILCPTRELAVQIVTETRRFSNGTSVQTALVVAGPKMPGELSKVKRGADIIVGTPGRVHSIATGRKPILCLDHVSFVVLDEADRILNLGLIPTFLDLLNGIRGDRQMAMFSATFNKLLHKAAKRIMKDAVEVRAGSLKSLPPNIQHFVRVVETKDKKLESLLSLLTAYASDSNGILIFVNTKEAADFLWLRIIKSGWSAAVMHGGHASDDRLDALYRFRRGDVSVLVATSLAARGLDIPHVSLVINYEPCRTVEEYVHRTGRCGRAGRAGVAYTVFTIDEGDRAGPLIRMLKMAKADIPSDLYLTAKLQQRRRKALTAPGSQTSNEASEERPKKRRKLNDKSNMQNPSPAILSVVEKARAFAKKISERRVLSLGYHTDRIDINDYGRTSRSIVTKKEFLEDIFNDFKVGIKIKGLYCPSGRTSVDEKLHMVLTCKDIVCLKKAKESIMKILEDNNQMDLDLGSRKIIEELFPQKPKSLYMLTMAQ